MKIRKERFFLILLLVLSFIKFFYKVPERTVFEYDQEFLCFEAKKIIVDRRFTLIGFPTSIGGMFVGPFYSYLLALFMLVFKMNPYVINYLMAFWGALTLPVIYFVCLDLFDFKTAFFASLIALISVYFLNWVSPLIQPLALVSLLIFWTVLKSSRDRRYLWLNAALVGWAFHLHFSAIFFPIIVFLCFLLNKEKLKFSQILIMFFILFLFLSPLFLFEARHNLFITKNLLNFLKDSVSLGQNVGSDISLLESLVWSFEINLEHLASFLFINNLSVQTFLVIITICFALRILWLKDKKMFKVFLVWLLVPIFLFSFYKGNISPYYFSLQAVMFFPAVGLFFAALSKKRILRLLLVVFFFLFLTENFVKRFFTPVPRSLENKIKALKYIQKHSRNEQIYLSHTTEFGVGYGFDYLEWYLKINKKEDKNLPIYTIVVPYDWHGIKTDFQFGDYGVILPEPE